MNLRVRLLSAALLIAVAIPATASFVPRNIVVEMGSATW